MEIERVAYLSHFEELVNEFGVGIQHVFGDAEGPGFSYTVGLFEADHPEFIVFGFSEEMALRLLNDLADAVLKRHVRFEANDRVHDLFRDAPAHLMPAVDSTGDYLGTSYAIRARRYPEFIGKDVPALHLVCQDPAGYWPWEPACDYFDWPRLDVWPSPEDMRNITMPHRD